MAFPGPKGRVGHPDLTQNIGQNPKDGIEAFDALVEQFMSIEPYHAAPRVFVVVDNGSAHRGQRSSTASGVLGRT